jgi:hypothetical protein
MKQLFFGRPLAESGVILSAVYRATFGPGRPDQATVVVGVG